MRLIDADEMKKDLRDRLKAFDCFESLAVQGAIVSLIDQQPTAYDVNKVVKELKESLYDDNTYGRCDDLETIVKRGGLNG